MTLELTRRALAWMNQNAPCLHLHHLFSRNDGFGIRVAREICNECPLKQPCLEHALAHNEAGIWGGTTGIQRTHIRQKLLSTETQSAVTTPRDASGNTKRRSA